MFYTKKKKVTCVSEIEELARNVRKATQIGLYFEGSMWLYYCLKDANLGKSSDKTMNKCQSLWADQLALAAQS